MNLASRYIPLLLVDNFGVWQTERFRKTKYLGDPCNLTRIFSDKEVDELVVIDISATSKKGEGYPQKLSSIEKIASECFSPLSYGGGIGSFSVAQDILRLGLEKIVIQRMLFQNPEDVMKIADTFGTQSVLASLDVKKDLDAYFTYSNNGQKCVGPLDEILDSCEGLGVGEYLIQSIERDGTRVGPDLELIQYVASRTSAPVIYGGGINSESDMVKGVRAGASAIAASSFFTMLPPYDAVVPNYISGRAKS